jgi:hypothetical protein
MSYFLFPEEQSRGHLPISTYRSLLLHRQDIRLTCECNGCQYAKFSTSWLCNWSRQFVQYMKFSHTKYSEPQAVWTLTTFHSVPYHITFPTDSLVYNQEVAVSVRVTNEGATQQMFDVTAADTAGFVTDVIKHVTLDGKQTKTMDIHLTAIPPATYTLVLFNFKRTDIIFNIFTYAFLKMIIFQISMYIHVHVSSFINSNVWHTGTCFPWKIVFGKIFVLFLFIKKCGGRLSYGESVNIKFFYLIQETYTYRTQTTFLSSVFFSSHRKLTVTLLTEGARSSIDKHLLVK